MHFSSSSTLKVLQEQHVWAEDAGWSRGRVRVRSFWSEACSLALKLHTLPKLHGEVAHIKTQSMTGNINICIYPTVEICANCTFHTFIKFILHESKSEDVIFGMLIKDLYSLK